MSLLSSVVAESEEKVRGIPPLHSQGFELDRRGSGMGLIQPGPREDAEAQRQFFAEEGYLYIPGFFSTDEARTVRMVLLDRLAELGELDPAAPREEGRLRPDSQVRFLDDPVTRDPAITALLYGRRAMDFFSHFFGAPAGHFDFTWLRAVGPGKGTAPHCDKVYMGRGTPHLVTAWVPWVDISYPLGGLMILERSHHQADRIAPYLSRDVDSYCTNGRHAEAIEAGRRSWEWDGKLSANPFTLREKLGGRWLVGEFRAGDLLIFGMHTVHASTDNQTNQVRLSTDTRYQRASEPFDPRWVGERPAGHGLSMKRGRIC
jgi:Phytanoyl-CoA dioxygenase (PhyH)